MLNLSGRTLCLFLCLAALPLFHSQASYPTEEDLSVDPIELEPDEPRPSIAPESDLAQALDREKVFERFIEYRAASLEGPLLLKSSIIRTFQETNAIQEETNKLVFNVSREVLETIRYLQDSFDLFFLRAKLGLSASPAFRDQLEDNLADYWTSINAPAFDKLLPLLEAEIENARVIFRFGKLPFLEDMNLYRGVSKEKKVLLIDAHFSNLPPGLRSKIESEADLSVTELKAIYSCWVGLRTTNNPKSFLEAMSRRFEFYRSLPTSASETSPQALVKAFVESAQDDRKFFGENVYEAAISAYQYYAFIKNGLEPSFDFSALRKLNGDYFDFHFLQAYTDGLTLKKLAERDPDFFVDEKTALRMIPNAIGQLYAGDQFSKSRSDVIFYSMASAAQTDVERARFRNNMLYYLGSQNTILSTIADPVAKLSKPESLANHFQGIPGPFSHLLPSDALAIVEGRFFELPEENRMAVIAILYPKLTLNQIRAFTTLSDISKTRSESFSLILLTGDNPNLWLSATTQPSSQPSKLAEQKGKPSMIVLMDGTEIYSQAYLRELATGLHNGESLPPLRERLNRKWKVFKDTLARNVKRYQVQSCPIHTEWTEVYSLEDLDPRSYADIRIEGESSHTEMLKTAVRKYVDGCPHCEAERAARGPNNATISQNENHLLDKDEVAINTAVLFLTPYIKLFSPQDDIGDPARERAWGMAKFGMVLAGARILSRSLMELAVTVDTLIYFGSGFSKSYTGIPSGIIQFGQDSVQVYSYTRAYIESGVPGHLYTASERAGSLSGDLVMLGIGSGSTFLIGKSIGLSPFGSRVANLEWRRDVVLESERIWRNTEIRQVERMIKDLEQKYSDMKRNPRLKMQAAKIGDRIADLEVTKADLTYAQVRYMKGRALHYALGALKAPLSWGIRNYSRSHSLQMVERAQRRTNAAAFSLRRQSRPGKQIFLDLEGRRLSSENRQSALSHLKEKAAAEKALLAELKRSDTVEADLGLPIEKATKLFTDYQLRNIKPDTAANEFINEQAEAVSAAKLAQDRLLKRVPALLKASSETRVQAEISHAHKERYEELLGLSDPGRNPPLAEFIHKTLKVGYAGVNRFLPLGQLRRQVLVLAELKLQKAAFESRREAAAFELEVLEHEQAMLERVRAQMEATRTYREQLEGTDPRRTEMDRLNSDIAAELIMINQTKESIAQANANTWGADTARVEAIQKQIDVLRRDLLEDHNRYAEKKAKSAVDPLPWYSPRRLLNKLIMLEPKIP